MARRTDLVVRNRQRLVITHHAKAVLAQFGHEIIARSRRPFDLPLPVATERRSELDPQLPLVDEVAPGVHMVAANQHRRACAAGCVEQNFGWRNDGLDRVSALEHGFAPFENPAIRDGVVDIAEWPACHQMHTRPFDEIGVHRRVAEALGLEALDTMTMWTLQDFVQYDDVVKHPHFTHRRCSPFRATG